MDFKNDIKNQNYKYANDKSKINEQAFNEQEFLKNVNHYKNLPQDDLMREFLKLSGNLKRNNGLDVDKINQIYSTLSPMLTPEQKQKLQNLLGMI